MHWTKNKPLRLFLIEKKNKSMYNKKRRGKIHEYRKINNRKEVCNPCL